MLRTTVKLFLIAAGLWTAACAGQAQEEGPPPGPSGYLGGPGSEVAVRMFDAGRDGMWLTKLEFRMSEYPDVLHPRLYLVDQDMRVIHIIEAILPPPLEEGWVQVPIPSLQVPRHYGIALTPYANPEEITDANPPNSFVWTPGGLRRVVREGNWAIRTSVSGKPAPAIVAPDLVVLTSGESFFGKLEKITPDPPTLHFAGRAPIPAVSVAAVCPDAVKILAPGPMQAVVRLRNGRAFTGELVSADETTVVLKVGGVNRSFKRDDIMQLDFRQDIGTDDAEA
ncbi:MAG: hypothetical protein ABFE08_05145 [Armatimonadia bacterium]